MDTHGHHRVLAEAVAPRLIRAYAEKGVEGYNLNALYLGNWLADLSQFNDPGSAAMAQILTDVRETVASRDRLGAGIATKFSGAAAAVAQEVGARIDRKVIAKLAHLIRQRVENLVEAYAVTAVAGADSNPAAQLGPTAIHLIRVLGYLKFARAESHPQGLEVPFNTYLEIFDELCRQYFPHEHVDRPQCAASYGPVCEAAWGPQYAGRPDRLVAVAKTAYRGETHIYDYLRDDRRLIAGRLAALDLDWASRDLASGTMVTPAERDRALARLGHTLHGVEDFFAHSNFTEHAVINAGGAQGLHEALRTRSARRIGEPSTTTRAAHKVWARLQRYTPDTESGIGGASQPELAVVTGYFDGWDTLNSFLHAAEEMVRPALLRMGAPGHPIVSTIKALLDRYADETVQDVLDVFSLRPFNDPRSFEAKIHRALDGLLEYVVKQTANGAAASKLVAERANEDPILVLLPEPLLRESLIPAVVGLVRVVRIGKAQWTVYKAIKAIAEFGEDPVAYLLKPLLDEGDKNLLRAYLRIVADLVGKKALADLNYLIVIELEDFFRAGRVGCHSLLAKDQPTEPLYDQMFSLARHADWMIADTLSRWSNADWVTNTQADDRWVAWDELLERYLRSPADTPGTPRRRTTVRQVPSLRFMTIDAPGETLRSAYGRLVAQARDVYHVGSYEEYLAANLGIQPSQLLRPNPVAGTTMSESVVEDLVVDAGLALPKGSSHSLKVGTRLTLPVEVSVEVDVVEATTWFADVMNRSYQSWLEEALSYERSRLTTTPPEFGHGPLPFLRANSGVSARRSIETFVAEAATIRSNLEAAYPQR